MSSSIEHWHHDHCSGLEPILKGGELICKQQAIDALRNYLVGKDVHCDGTMMARLIENEVINKLPSAQPDTYWKEQCQSYERTINKLRESLSAKSESFEWCTDCKEYDQEKHCCPRWNKVIKKTIDEMKPEIVHCGECKHYVFVDDRMDRFPIRGCSVTGFRDVDAGDFCSRAERREDG